MMRSSPNGRVPRRLRTVALPLLLWLLAGACGCDTLVPAPEPNTPQGNFEALWREFDARYALFAVRHVDWDSLHAVHAPRVHDDTGPRELFQVMCDLLAPLGDRHVTLDAPRVGWFKSGYDDMEPYFPDGVLFEYDTERTNQQSVIHRYLDPASDGYGSREFALLRPERAGGQRLYYLELESMNSDGDVDWSRVAQFLAAAPDCDGIILDLRGNVGGSVRYTELVLDGLADSRRAYGAVRQRNGPGRQDFGPPTDLVMTPTGTGWGDVPLVVLTDPFTASAGEWTTMALGYRARTTIIGTRTMGIFSARSEYLLPNGWQFTCCGDLVTDADGICWEGRGLPPDLEVRNTAAANAARRDLALDAALTLLGGTPAP